MTLLESNIQNALLNKMGSFHTRKNGTKVGGKKILFLLVFYVLTNFIVLNPALYIEYLNYWEYQQGLSLVILISNKSIF